MDSYSQPDSPFDAVEGAVNALFDGDGGARVNPEDVLAQCFEYIKDMPGTTETWRAWMEDQHTRYWFRCLRDMLDEAQADLEAAEGIEVARSQGRVRGAKDTVGLLKWKLDTLLAREQREMSDE